MWRKITSLLPAVFIKTKTDRSLQKLQTQIQLCGMYCISLVMKMVHWEKRKQGSKNDASLMLSMYLPENEVPYMDCQAVRDEKQIGQNSGPFG